MAMIQAVSYNFSTVENPLSDGGVFTTVADTNFTGSLQAIAANKCEVVSTGKSSASFYSGSVPAPSNTWPADQYTEVTLTTWSIAGSYTLFLLRQGTFNGGTQYQAYIEFDLQNYSLSAAVGNTIHTLVAPTSQASAQGDVFRLSVTGNVITLSRNGSVVNTFTDTNNYVTAGSPGFGFYDTTAITNAQTSLWAAGANRAATPTFNPGAGSYTGTQTVTITSASGGTIYYTTDGSTPTHSSSSIASGSTISVSSSETVKAIASAANNLDSATGSAIYIITQLNTSFTQSYRDFINLRGIDDTPPKYW